MFLYSNLYTYNRQLEKYHIWLLSLHLWYRNGVAMMVDYGTFLDKGI